MHIVIVNILFHIQNAPCIPMMVLKIIQFTRTTIPFFPRIYVWLIINKCSNNLHFNTEYLYIDCFVQYKLNVDSVKIVGILFIVKLSTINQFPFDSVIYIPHVAYLSKLSSPALQLPPLVNEHGILVAHTPVFVPFTTKCFPSSYKDNM